MAYVFDLGKPATNANPFPEFAHLRANDPVHWSPVMKAWISCLWESRFIS